MTFYYWKWQLSQVFRWIQILCVWYSEVHCIHFSLCDVIWEGHTNFISIRGLKFCTYCIGTKFQGKACDKYTCRCSTNLHKFPRSDKDWDYTDLSWDIPARCWPAPHPSPPSWSPLRWSSSRWRQCPGCSQWRRARCWPKFPVAKKNMLSHFSYVLFGVKCALMFQLFVCVKHRPN